MTITPKIWMFPTFPINKQLFHVPGAAIEGGFTSGGARILSPEPGGFGVLEIQPALITTEFDYPLASWLISKTNGEILRVRLAPTPQVASARAIRSDSPWNAEGIYSESPWSNLQNWSGDFTATYYTNALEGSNSIQIDLDGIGPVLQPGHVIGHAYDTYLIDEVTYAGTVATIVVRAPFRRNINIGDNVMFRPYFTGTIANGNDIRNAYDADIGDNYQPTKIVLNEVIV